MWKVTNVMLQHTWKGSLLSAMGAPRLPPNSKMKCVLDCVPFDNNEFDQSRHWRRMFSTMGTLYTSNKQTGYWSWFFNFWRLYLRMHILDIWCNEDIMIYYNNHNNSYCWTVNVRTFKTIEHNTVYINTLLHTRNPYCYSHFEIFICIYSIRDVLDQISTNTLRYTACCAANVDMFAYIFIGVPIVPLTLISTTRVNFDPGRV